MEANVVGSCSPTRAVFEGIAGAMVEWRAVCDIRQSYAPAYELEVAICGLVGLVQVFVD